MAEEKFNNTGLADIGFFDPGQWDRKIPKQCLVDRDETILKLCREQSVLHLGAADYPFHKEAARHGELLHQKIQRVTKNVVGIDQNREAVEYLKIHHAIDNIISGDTTFSIRDARLTGQFDIILCCDIIEHVENPGHLIEFCKSHMTERTTLVITTINASAIKVALRAVLGREAVHNDHVAYYSYSTLCQLLLRYQLYPAKVGYYCYGTKIKILGKVFGVLAAISPGTADGILIVCNKA